MTQPERVKRFFDQRKHAEEGTWAPPPGVLDATVRSASADLTPMRPSKEGVQDIIWNPPVPPPRPRRRRWSLDILSQVFVQPFLWLVYWLSWGSLDIVIFWPVRLLCYVLMTVSAIASIYLIVFSVFDYQASLRDKEDDDLARLNRGEAANQHQASLKQVR